MDDQSWLQNEAQNLKKAVEAIQQSIAQLEQRKPDNGSPRSPGEGKPPGREQTSHESNANTRLAGFQRVALIISTGILVIILILMITLLSFQVVDGESQFTLDHLTKWMVEQSGESRLLAPPWSSPARLRSEAVRRDAWTPTPTPLATPRAISTPRPGSPPQSMTEERHRL